jgi:hypothetical protein
MNDWSKTDTAIVNQTTNNLQNVGQEALNEAQSDIPSTKVNAPEELPITLLAKGKYQIYFAYEWVRKQNSFIEEGINTWFDFIKLKKDLLAKSNLSRSRANINAHFDSAQTSTSPGLISPKPEYIECFSMQFDPKGVTVIVDRDTIKRETPKITIPFGPTISLSDILLPIIDARMQSQSTKINPALAAPAQRRL